MDIYAKTVIFVDDAFGGKQKPHFERAVFWICKFLPNCSEAHRVAAYSHDIERAMRDDSVKVPNNYLDTDFLEYHQNEGARIMAKFLTRNGASPEFVDVVTHLISRHELGGDKEQNAMMDADSVSFFETNAEIFVKEKALFAGTDKVKKKLDWMFNRIHSAEARKAASLNYQRWSTELSNLDLH